MNTPAQSFTVRDRGASASVANLANPRILVVDDDPLMREIHAALLRLEGYVVEDAENGAEALEQLRNGGFDLVLTDQEMPQLGGLELIRAIRGAGSRVPIVMVSASLADAALPRDIAPEVSAALPKPARAAGVLAAVAHALSDSKRVFREMARERAGSPDARFSSVANPQKRAGFCQSARSHALGEHANFILAEQAISSAPAWRTAPRRRVRQTSQQTN